MSSALGEAVLGQVLDGRYRLQRIHLHGIFGVVFAADEYFGRTYLRPVHVKVSRQTGITDVTAPYFFADAICLAQWLAADSGSQRWHVPAIFHMGIWPAWESRGFMVTEAAVGVPLLQWRPQGRRPDLATQLAVFQCLAQTLAAVHRLGVVHRDLRPDAVVIDAAGTVQVLGLGLANGTEPLAVGTEAAQALFAHLAPESLQGSGGPAADVYSLGLILYEWLTGGGPHLTAPGWPAVRSVADVLQLKRRLDFVAPSVLRPEIRTQASWLDEMVLRCLAADPGQRFCDAGQVVAALEGGAAGKTLPSNSPASPPAKVPLVQHHDDPTETLIRAARCHLARGEAQQAIDQLDIHRPAEWAVIDGKGARLLRVLGQAYARRGDWQAARECLEQLRSVQREQGLLAPAWYAGTLTDLLRCYQQLGLKSLAEAARQEAQQSVQSQG